MDFLYFVEIVRQNQHSEVIFEGGIICSCVVTVEIMATIAGVASTAEVVAKSFLVFTIYSINNISIMKQSFFNYLRGSFCKV